MANLKRSWLVLLTIPAGALLASARPVATDRDQVRERRAAYSADIEERRPDLMRRFLAREMVQLSSDGEAAIGREVVLKSYSGLEFRDPNFIAYERIPDTIYISDNGRFAVERGHWRGRFRQPNGGVTGNSGLYQAGWIKRDGTWLIRTESYVRLHCADEKDCPK